MRLILAGGPMNIQPIPTEHAQTKDKKEKKSLHIISLSWAKPEQNQASWTACALQQIIKRKGW
jgi:hypothetical protein